jgi:hypothetical protein
MDDREVFRARGRDGDSRDPFNGRRERGKKRERQITDGVTKFGTIRPVPGIDGIECCKLRHAGVFDHAQQIQPRIGDSPGAIRKADQGKKGARGPDFGINGAGRFQGREGKDDVPDRAGANQQAAANG